MALAGTQPQRATHHAHHRATHHARPITHTHDEEHRMSDDRVRDQDDPAAADPVDREAAQIDARSEDAPEEIEELIEHARDLGRDAPGEGSPPKTTP
jgi:hypothetical protein